ncbi:MAG: hypothetical protein SOV58_01755 [Candidatus Enteromonas sp.]|nr:hypothetical protein [Candidatus Enteromonas sp.]
MQKEARRMLLFTSFGFLFALSFIQPIPRKPFYPREETQDCQNLGETPGIPAISEMKIAYCSEEVRAVK